MPAYFSIYVECDKKMLFHGLVGEFCGCLLEGGFVFAHGGRGCEEDSLEEIIAWNQRKLEDNFELGYTEHYSHNYKQILFAYGGFSKVRMFMLNSGEKEMFTFVIVIPEDELIDWNMGRPQYNQGKIEPLVSVCEKIWTQPYVNIIQTALEQSYGVPSLDAIKSGRKPGVEPFAILRKELIDVELRAKFRWREIGRDGLVLLLE